ncbi:hypothetical protein [Prauserella cavernicola]|uniref:Uncharacterized protein n=1 Tax=Prauserella cavernicola TaxID=2800127 RepID=A0A934QVA8_9PSEU|nr:hypothetical protein [Prauserella cavernicola]MBK1787115.1 hypothetical protein [Prauserella cavernicola]
MARDRTARTRIRNYLVGQGPVDDPSGHATSVLKDLIGYEGSGVAFIQLIAAMDRDGEIAREIRGKRTYRISATPSATRAAVPQPAPVRPDALTVPLSQATDVEDGVVRIDYDKLARAVVRQLSGVAASPTGESHEEITADIEALRAERDRMIEERNEYAQRLQTARVKLDELLGVSEQREHEIKA